MSTTQSVTGFSFSYPNHQIVQNLNLKLEDNSKIAIIGSNGVGKTTILNELWKNSFESGNVKFANRKIYFTQHLPKLDFNPQKIAENYFDLLLEIYLNDTQKQNGRSLDFYPPNYAEWIMDLVSEPIVEFKSDLNVYFSAFRLIPSQFPDKFSLLSPGTQKKVLLAILMASKPDIILADELTNHLDKEAILALSNLLNRNKTPVLLIDHNQEFLQETVSQYIFIPDNKDRMPIHYKGKYKDFRIYLDELQLSLQNQYNQLERKRTELQDQSQNLQSLAKRYSESSKIGSMKKSVARNLEKIENDPILSNSDLSKSVKFRATENKSKVKNSLLCRSNNIEPLKFKLGENKNLIVKNFEVYQGQKIRITGKNGAGKSTLTKSLVYQFENRTQDGFAQYISGKWDIGDTIERKNVFMMVQLTDYPEGKSIENYLFENTDLDPYQYNSFLKSIELSKFSLNSFISTLSLGEFIRLQIAVMARMIHEIKLIILDEPGNFLDIFTQKALIDLLAKYHHSLIFITHDDILANEIGFDREYLLR